MLNWLPAAKWAYGLFAAFIGGGASAITTAFGAGIIAPGQFNLQDTDGMWNMGKLVVLTFIVNGTLSAFWFLKDSPLPRWDGIDRRQP